MSDPASSSASAETWVPLAPDQRRVLGVLIEKQKTSKSADAYPMSLNSITTGCNQKSNRDPVTDYSEDDVEETLTNLQRRGLVAKVTGSRVDRYRHLLYEVWKTTKVEMAILAELLLRGPQTEGDLRGRASRMDDIKDVDELRGLLKILASRNLVVYLTPPERRGTMLTHGFHTPEELARAKQTAGQSVDADPLPRTASSQSEPRASTSALEARLTEVLEEIARLKERVAKLESQRPM